MALVTKTTHTQIIQPALPLEGLITTLLPDHLEFILISTNQSEKTRLVSRHWKDLTLTIFIKYKPQELKQTISLLTENLDPVIYAQCSADLVNFPHRSDYAGIFTKVRRLFLTDKGLVIGILKKLTNEEIDILQIAVDNQLPDSMKNLFELSKFRLITEVCLWTAQDGNLNTLFTQFQSLSVDHRRLAIFNAVQKNDTKFIKFILENEPISDKNRNELFMEAARNNHLEIIELLLANGPISEAIRAHVIKKALENNHPELVELLRGPFLWRIAATLRTALKIIAMLGVAFAAAGVGIYVNEWFSSKNST